MPCQWSDTGFGDFTGTVRWRRRFGYPGRLDPHERVWLCVEQVGSQTAIRLNNQPVRHAGASSGAFEHDVTPLLHVRNELILEGTTAEQGGFVGEVALEVRCTAFLRRLRCFARANQPDAALRVTGEVVGVADRPLELYLLLNRTVVGYQTVSAAPQGQPFQLVASDTARDTLGGAPRIPGVQVDLVNGAVVWDTREIVVEYESAASRDG